VVPAGDREIRFTFHSKTFRQGALITLAGIAFAALMVALPMRRNAVGEPSADLSSANR